jgi:hypothetical protein
LDVKALSYGARGDKDLKGQSTAFMVVVAEQLER